jgi:hypothetical protein
VPAAIALVSDLIVNLIGYFLIQVLFYFFKILFIFTQPLIWAAVLFALSLGLWWSQHWAAVRWLMLVALGWTPAETFESGIRKAIGKLKATFGLTLPAWQQGVERMLAEIWV